MQSPISLVIFNPVVGLGLCQTENVLRGVRGSLAAANMQEIQSAGSLVQVFFIAGRIAIGAVGTLLDESSGFGVVLFLADNLFNGTNLLSSLEVQTNYTSITGKIKLFLDLYNFFAPFIRGFYICCRKTFVDWEGFV